MSKTQWTQLLLVGIPVLSLIGAWLALRTWTRLTDRHHEGMTMRDDHE